jgi:glycosyltransferase involved in cell wall biosynthesis
MNKTKIFYAVPDFFPPWRADVHELFIKKLPEKGCDITWSARIKGANRTLHRTFQGQEFFLPPQLSGGHALVKISNKLLQYSFELFILFGLLIGPRFDIIQVRDRRYFFAVFARVIAWLRRSKFVFWSSYPFPESLIEQSNALHGIKKITKLIRGYLSFYYLYRIILPLCDHIFVQSDQMKIDIAAYGIDKEKMTAVPMAVAQVVFDATSSNNKHTSIPGKIVYLGSFAAIRRLEVIINAFAQVLKIHTHAKLFMVGAGDVPAEQAHLEHIAQKLDILSAIVFTGFLPQDQALAHASSAEVCLSPFYPSNVLRSTSPTKLVEYMALGKPVVGNDHPEQAEIINKSKAGICVPWSDTHFANAIDLLLSDPDQANQMRLNGPAWVKQNRTYERISEAVRQKYQTIISSPATPA